MMYSDVDNDLPPFNDTIDGEEIFLFSNPKTATAATSFLHEDDDDHLRHQHNVVGASSSSHLPVDVDELLLSSNFLEQPNCDQSEDPLFWSCKDISDDHLNEFLPQSHLNLSNNNNNTGNTNSNNNNNNGTHNHNSSNGNLTNTTTSNNNVNNPSNNLASTSIAQIQHMPPPPHQNLIPIQHLQTHNLTQPLNQTQAIHQLQQPQIRIHQNLIQQHQPQQQQQQLQITTQLQPQSRQSEFPSQQIIHLDQYQTKWVTLVQTNDQFQTFTNQQPQFFDKIAQHVTHAGVVTTVAPATITGNLMQHQDQRHVAQQQIIQIAPVQQASQLQQIQIQTHQPPSQPQQLQGKAAPTNPQQQHSANLVPPHTQSTVDRKPKLSAQTVATSNGLNATASNTATSNSCTKINNAPLVAQPIKKDSIVKTKTKEKQTRLDCPFCKRSFSKNFDLQQHMRCHTGEKPFQCIVCGRGFAQKSNVKKHMQAHKVWPEGPNNNPPSNSNGNTRSRNNSASSSIGTPRDDECMQENEASQTNDNNLNSNGGIALGLSNDRKNNDGSDIFAENRYSCSYCDFNGRTYFELKSHLTIHKREKVFKCIISSCGKTFSGSDLQGFLDHVTGHKDLIYSCHLCSGQFYSLDEFGEHQKNHSHSQLKRTTQNQLQTQSSHQQTSVSVLNQQNTSLRQQNQQVTITQPSHQQHPVKLQITQQQATQSQQLNKNSQLYGSNQSQQPPSSKNNQKYFRCSKCMNRYTTQSALDHHLSIAPHHYQCVECKKVFMCERYLRRHLNTHTTVQHVCTFCDKQFKTAAYLKMHSVVHTGEKPFRCNLCEAAFNRRDKLNRHKLTHETVKKFKCPFKPHIGCTKEFNRPDKLKAHVLTHSGVKPHKCDSCTRTFSRLSRLREHKKHHDNNNNNIESKSGVDRTVEASKQVSQSTQVMIPSGEVAGDTSSEVQESVKMELVV